MIQPSPSVEIMLRCMGCAGSVDEDTRIAGMVRVRQTRAATAGCAARVWVMYTRARIYRRAYEQLNSVPDSRHRMLRAVAISRQNCLNIPTQTSYHFLLILESRLGLATIKLSIKAFVRGDSQLSTVHIMQP